MDWGLCEDVLEVVTERVEVIVEVMVFVEVEVGVTSRVGKVLLVEVVVLVDVFDAVDVGEFARPFAFRFLTRAVVSTGGEVATRPIDNNNKSQRMLI